jgi:hypothetical protein
MPLETFRFMSLRPAQALSPTRSETISVRAYQSPPTSLHRALAHAARADRPGDMKELARNFLRAKRMPREYVLSIDDLPTPFRTLDTWLLDRLNDTPTPKEFVDEAVRVFGQTLIEVVRSKEFAVTQRRLADSTLAATIADDVHVDRKSLIRTLKLGALVQRLAVAGPDGPNTSAQIHTALGAIVVLPSDVFPSRRPDAHDGAATLRRPTVGSWRKRVRADPVVRLTTELKALKSALAELRATQLGDIVPRNEDALRREFRQQARVGARRNAPVEIMDDVAPGYSFGLSARSRQALSAGTKSVLKNLGLPLASVDTPTATSAIENRIVEVGSQLFMQPGKKRWLPIGSSFSGGALGDSGSASAVRDPDVPFPGPCPPSIAAPNSQSDPKEAMGVARIAGIADLMVVEQQILKYELAEVAHIENVMMAEDKNRSHRRADTAETTLFIETERATEAEQDLESAERFEMESESQETINQDASRHAGITINASYGPSVDATLAAGAVSNDARSESVRAASSYAREITARTASRIVERRLERRSTRTVAEVEEFNSHRLNNADGADHVVGVYRWVDKVYTAQVMNYGSRLMVEFNVPEPAAFARYASQTAPEPDAPIVEPVPPGHCINGKFVPLDPSGIRREDYFYWAAQYSVALDPPPASYQVIGTVISESNLKSDSASAKAVTTGFDVPPGYVARIGYRTLGRLAGPVGKERRLDVEVGRNTMTTAAQRPLHSETTLPVGAIAANVVAYTVNVEMLCELTPEGFQTWQMKNFTAIMTAYRELQSRFEQQLRERRLAKETMIERHHPSQNRDLEQTELKKWCVVLLTGKSPGSAGSITTGPNEAPGLDVPVAASEGRYIQFLEHAFDWAHMTYVFYPYFWARPAEWLGLYGIKDEDPLFARFLQAGSARVVVPVRKNYEPLVANFIGVHGQGDPWAYADIPQVDDADGLYVSIVDELREQQGAESQERIGIASATQGVETINASEDVFHSKDQDRRIVLNGRNYRIVEVISRTAVRLHEPYKGATEARARFSLGALYVGNPWEVRLPTSLVVLQRDAVLPDWSGS